ncbi:MAG: hypothetical protein WBE27_01865 [Microgenomates group bacterium]
MDDKERERRPYCWKRHAIYDADPEKDPVSFAVTICEYRESDGIILRERFFCTHPEAPTSGFSVFCEPFRKKAST